MFTQINMELGDQVSNSWLQYQTVHHIYQQFSPKLIWFSQFYHYVCDLWLNHIDTHLCNIRSKPFRTWADSSSSCVSVLWVKFFSFYSKSSFKLRKNDCAQGYCEASNITKWQVWNVSQFGGHYRGSAGSPFLNSTHMMNTKPHITCSRVDAQISRTHGLCGKEKSNA